MESSELAEKRRIFELFTDIQNYIDEPDTENRLVAAQKMDSIITLFTAMQVAEVERLGKITANVEFQKSLCADIVASLMQHLLMLMRAQSDLSAQFEKKQAEQENLENKLEMASAKAQRSLERLAEVQQHSQKAEELLKAELIFRSSAEQRLEQELDKTSENDALQKSKVLQMAKKLNEQLEESEALRSELARLEQDCARIRAECEERTKLGDDLAIQSLFQLKENEALQSEVARLEQSKDRGAQGEKEWKVELELEKKTVLDLERAAQGQRLIAEGLTRTVSKLQEELEEKNRSLAVWEQDWQERESLSEMKEKETLRTEMARLEQECVRIRTECEERTEYVDDLAKQNLLHLEVCVCA
jgi:hypothetical protein